MLTHHPQNHEEYPVYAFPLEIGLGIGRTVYLTMVSLKWQNHFPRNRAVIIYLHKYHIYAAWLARYLCTSQHFKHSKWNFNTLRPGQNGRYFTDDTYKCIFLNENALISLKISLKFVPKVRINNIPALVQIMAWRRPGDKPLSEPMLVSLLTHICVTRPQWVMTLWGPVTPHNTLISPVGSVFTKLSDVLAPGPANSGSCVI